MISDFNSMFKNNTIFFLCLYTFSQINGISVPKKKKKTLNKILC